MIEHVYFNAKKCRLLNEVVVATDDQRIYDAVNGFGGKAIMTSDHIRRAPTSVAEAARQPGCRNHRQCPRG